MWENDSVELHPVPQAEEVTTLYHETVPFCEPRVRFGAGMVFYNNRLGGRVATLAYAVNMPFYKVLLPQRRLLLVEALDFLTEGTLPAIIEEGRRIMARYALLKDQRHLLGVINLGEDTLEGIRIRLSFEPHRIQVLKADGSWWKQPFIAIGPRRYHLDTTLPFYGTAIYRIE